jgi:hypothetical protein
MILNPGQTTGPAAVSPNLSKQLPDLRLTWLRVHGHIDLNPNLTAEFGGLLKNLDCRTAN